MLSTGYGFDFVPSNIDLAGAEVELRNVLAQETVLKRRLAPIASDYDYILIDTPPSLSVLTVNALTTAHSVLIPVACEPMALRGLARLFDIVANVQGVTNPDLRYLGIITTRYDSRTLNSREVHEYLQDLSDKQDIHLFNPVVKERVRIMEAPNAGIPIVITHPDLDSSMAYRQIAKEIIYGS